MTKKIIATGLLMAALLGGCAPSSTTILKNQQNQQIAMLQQSQAEILARPANTPQEKLAKQADLNTINKQINEAMKIQQNSQSISNQQTDNTIKSVLTGAAAIGGAAWGIHELTK